MKEERAQMNVRASTKALLVDFQYEHRLNSQDAAILYLLKNGNGFSSKRG